MTQQAVAVDAHVIVDQRMDKRDPVLLRAVGMMPQDDTFKCLVVNISPNGAMLQIDNIDLLPKRMKIFIPESKAMHECEVVWKRDSYAGVRFLSSTQYN